MSALSDVLSEEPVINSEEPWGFSEEHNLKMSVFEKTPIIQSDGGYAGSLTAECVDIVTNA